MQKKVCPYADQCGGCQLIETSYADQLAFKQATVAKLLRPFGKTEPICGMENPYHYRNKVHAVVTADRRGNPITGVYREGTHTVVPIEHCLIEDERADAIIATIRGLLPSFKLRPYDEDRRTGFLRHILIRAGKAELMLVLVTAKAEFPSKHHFVEAIRKAHPEITTIVQNVNDRQTNMVLGKRDIVLYGKGFIDDVLCGKTFRLSPQSFYQVNSRQTEVLYRLAIEAAQLTGSETVLDAYCGVGTIGLAASDKCRQVIGVELNPQAVKDAQLNARQNGVRNATFLCADAGRWLTSFASEGRRPDVVFMDPPRSGSDLPFLKALLQIKPPRIVYVSCSPQTLARDLDVLCKGGYAMERAVPVDMFPSTVHVETVVSLHLTPKGGRQ